ncbi:heat shock protein Hsp-16.48/Hsp-16.49-like [Culicoides brevitarsis]|uniref:heat shock protein Hsp-16.48/Hsp-16.49-like n=1 Tax=Culicoides brevitarsis TaxID=469753 RepID=UPI00307C573B
MSRRNNNRAVIPHSADNQITPFNATLTRMEEHFNDMMRQMDIFRDFRHNSLNSRIKTEIRDGNFSLNIDVSDFNPNDVQVEIQNHEVIVKATHRQMSQNSQSARQIQTRYLLPSNVDPTEAQINLNDGILVVEAPMLTQQTLTANNRQAIGF